MDSMEFSPLIFSNLIFKKDWSNNFGKSIVGSCKLLGKKKKTFIIDTPAVPNYLSVLIGIQILRNLWRICETPN
jgi:hypothetical protein